MFLFCLPSSMEHFFTSSLLFAHSCARNIAPLSLSFLEIGHGCPFFKMYENYQLFENIALYFGYATQISLCTGLGTFLNFFCLIFHEL